MSFEDWQSGASSFVSPSSSYVSMSTVEDLSYTPSEEERYRDAAQVIATGRRSWKTLKGKGEAVWPPNLEAALIEALEKYEPDSSKSNKTLGRFPMRNRFISDYIYGKTGKRRTPKQVGSRLQQLRDTCKGKHILGLISRRSRSLTDDSTYNPPSLRGASEFGIAVASSLLQAPSPSPSRRENLAVDVLILPGCSPWPLVLPTIRLGSGVNSSARIHLAMSQHSANPPIYSNDETHAIHSELRPCHLNPGITFSSSFKLCSRVESSVYVEGVNTTVHSEDVQLEQDARANGSELLYQTYLIPKYWHMLSDGEISRFTIRQRVATDEKDLRVPSEITITYRFVGSSPVPITNTQTACLTPASDHTWPLFQNACTPSELPASTLKTHDFSNDYPESQHPDFQYSLNESACFPDGTNNPEQDTTQIWSSYPAHCGVESLDSVFIDGRGLYLDHPISTDYRSSVPQTLAAAVVIPGGWSGPQSFYSTDFSQYDCSADFSRARF